MILNSRLYCILTDYSTYNDSIRHTQTKINISTDKNYKSVKKMVQESYLNTVCAEARCPNIYECWNRKTATLMILGDTCTRGCGFCSVKTGRPTWNDPMEPYRVAQAVKKMNKDIGYIFK